MSSRKVAKKGKGSPFLDLLPVAHSLEARKQGAIFQMMGAGPIMRKQRDEIDKQFARVCPMARWKPISLAELKYRRSFCGRVQALADTTGGLETQKLRAQAVKTIDGLISDALKHAKAPDLEEVDRVNWVRVIGYLFQVSKSIMHEYDAASIEAQLKELKRVVNNELEKRRRERAEQAARAVH